MNFKDKIKEIFHKFIDFFVYMFKDKPENVEEIISFTGENKISNLDSEKISYFSNILHKNDAKASEKIQSSLCYVVLGAIFAVIGIIFIFLSLRKRLNRIIGINFASVQFVVCVVSYGVWFVVADIMKCNLLETSIYRAIFCSLFIFLEKILRILQEHGIISQSFIRG